MPEGEDYRCTLKLILDRNVQRKMERVEVGRELIVRDHQQNRESLLSPFDPQKPDTDCQAIAGPCHRLVNFHMHCELIAYPCTPITRMVEVYQGLPCNADLLNSPTHFVFHE